MNFNSFNKIIKSYKKCPNCGSSYKDTKLQVELKDGIVIISCECGFKKKVDESNKEIN